MERDVQQSGESSALPVDAALTEWMRGRTQEQAKADLEHAAALARAERWHELLSTRYVCEACLTRYFMKYRKCKACGEVGRIRSLTASLLELADDDGELREMIANGQVFGVGSREPGAGSQ